MMQSFNMELTTTVKNMIENEDLDAIVKSLMIAVIIAKLSFLVTVAFSQSWTTGVVRLDAWVIRRQVRIRRNIFSLWNSLKSRNPLVPKGSILPDGIRTVKWRHLIAALVSISIFALEVGFIYLASSVEDVVTADTLPVTIELDQARLPPAEVGNTPFDDNVMSGGCKWFDVKGANFKIATPFGACIVSGEGVSDEFAIDKNNAEQNWTFEIGDSYVTTNITYYHFGNAINGVILHMSTTLAFVAISPSGGVLRVQHGLDEEQLGRMLVRHFKDVCNQDEVENVNGKWMPIGCNTGQFTKYFYAKFVSGLVVKNGGGSLHEGNLWSKDRIRSKSTVGTKSRTRVTMAVLIPLFITILVISVVVAYFDCDPEEAVDALAVNMLGGACSANPGTLDSVSLPVILSKSTTTSEGHLGLSVPEGFAEAKSLDGIVVKTYSAVAEIVRKLAVPKPQFEEVHVD